MKKSLIAGLGVLAVAAVIAAAFLATGGGSESSSQRTAGSSPTTATAAPIRDTFDRPDSDATLGQTVSGERWETATGKWGIKDKQAYVAKANEAGPRNFAVLDLGSHDGSVEARAKKVVEGWGLCFRMRNNNEWWALIASPQAGTFNIVRFQGGKEVNVGNIGLVTSADAVLRVEFLADQITVFVNNVAKKTVRDAAFSDQGTKVGLFAAGKQAPEARWTEFVAQRSLGGPAVTASARGSRGSTQGSQEPTTSVEPVPSTTPAQRGLPKDPASVKRVMVVGDSLMWGEWAPLDAKLKLRGIAVRYVGAGVTGPLWNNKQWARWLDEHLRDFDPQVVVIEGCCSYPGWEIAGGGQLYVNEAGVTVQPDTELMFTEWIKATRELVDLAKNRGASVWLANLPQPAPYATQSYDASFIDRVNRLRRDDASMGEPVIDWNDVIAGAPNETELRDEDGLHLSPAGSDVVADQIISRILG